VKKIAVTLIVFTLICGSLGVSKVEAEKVGRITKKLEELREASLKEMNLSDYPPKNIDGFDKKESHQPSNTTLSVWGADAGWLTFWEASNSGYEVNYHDLMIDVYKFDTKNKASNAIINEMRSYGEISIESLNGLPVMMVTWEHEDSNSVDTFIGYYQENIVILIQASKDVMDGSVSPDQLLQKVKRAFRAIAAKGRQ